jgi:hypothetical protein
MSKSKNTELGGSDFITIGDVKAPVRIWAMVNSYKTRERETHGRKLKTPEALLELAEIGGKAEKL